MGKAPDTMRKKKKKGRPSLLDLQQRALEQQKQQQQQQQQQLTTTTTRLPNNYTHRDFKSPQNPNRLDRTPSSSSSILRRRSVRRNHKLRFASLLRRSSDDDDPISSPSASSSSSSDDDEDERRQKKVKLVGRLPSADQSAFRIPSHPPFPKSSALTSSFAACSNSHSRPGFDTLFGRSSLNAVNIGRGCPDEGEKVQKATETQYGTGTGTRSAVQDGPTTAPLPDKKLLLQILDKLQKKDTRGAFAEPVDPEELPDYHEVIKNPMDFDTVRKKLDKGFYANLDQLEADIYLICSNAMQYNPPHTIYFRQARSIQELTKKEFDIVRQVDPEAPPKVARRGRPPKKVVESSHADHPKSSAEAPLSNNSGDEALRSNTYNLRKAPSLHRYHLLDGVSRRTGSGGHQSVEDHVEFQAPRAVSTRSSKKLLAVDESRRDTYHQSVSCASGDNSSGLSIAEGEEKQLIPVGLYVEKYSYARSLARYSANLGPRVWRFAAQKIRSVLPAGVEFGPGWVEEADSLSLSSLSPPMLPDKMLISAENQVYGGSSAHNRQQQSNMGSTSSPVEVVDKFSNLFSSEDMMLARGLGNHRQITLSSSDKVMEAGGTGYGPSLQSQHQLHLEAPICSTVNGMQSEFGFGFASQERVLMGSIGITANPSYCQSSNQINGVGFGDNIRLQTFEPSSFNRPGNYNGVNSLPAGVNGVTGMNLQQVKPTWQDVPMYGRWNPSSFHADLNVGFQASGSPSSSVHIGSPPQLDLMLQL